MKNTALRASILASAIVLMSGCATVEQLAEVRSMAELAQSAANSAQTTAGEALNAANQANEAARSAQAAAQAASACCNENSSRLDRMFEKAMQK